MEKPDMESQSLDNAPSPRDDSPEKGYANHGRRVSLVDDVFGEIREDGPNYRSVSLSHAHEAAER
jgi:hypothetical protein